MTELQEKIIANIQSADGVADWEGVINNLDHREAQGAYSAVRQLSKSGVVKREAKFVPNEGVSVTYSLVEAATIESAE